MTIEILIFSNIMFAIAAIQFYIMMRSYKALAKAYSKQVEESILVIKEVAKTRDIAIELNEKLIKEKIFLKDETISLN